MSDLEDQQYQGESKSAVRCTSNGNCNRYVNLGPTKIRERLESESDPDERTALSTALSFWTRKSNGTVAGQPYRGEERQVRRVSTMTELVKDMNPVEHVYVLGEMTAGSCDIIDMEMLNE